MGKTKAKADDQDTDLEGESGEHPVTVEPGEWVVKADSKTKQIHTMLAGGTSAAITRFASQPLDVLKVRFQLQLEPLGQKGTHSKYRNVVQAARTIYVEEGLFSLWRGHNPAQILSIIYGVSQFWIYERLRHITKKTPFLKDHKNLSTFLSGAMAGSTATTITMPVDVVRTRLIAQDVNKGYTSGSKAIVTILREEGIRGCYRGLTSSIIQIGPMMGSNFMFYRLFSRTAEGYFKVEHRGHLPSWMLLAMGSTAGLLSKTLVYPLDLIKKRLQIQGFQKNRTAYGANMSCWGIIQCFELTVEKEGFRGLYKGMTPTLLKSGWMTGLHFGLYDKIFSILQKVS